MRDEVFYQQGEASPASAGEGWRTTISHPSNFRTIGQCNVRTAPGLICKRHSLRRGVMPGVMVNECIKKFSVKVCVCHSSATVHANGLHSALGATLPA
jgi:hypothetical protein